MQEGGRRGGADQKGGGGGKNRRGEEGESTQVAPPHLSNPFPHPTLPPHLIVPACS